MMDHIATLIGIYCHQAFFFFFLAKLKRLVCFFLRYEGTGRALSLKLIQKLRLESVDSQQSLSAENQTKGTNRKAAGN